LPAKPLLAAQAWVDAPEAAARVAHFVPYFAAVATSGPRPRPAILIAEGQSELRHVLSHIFRDAPYDVRFAADGVEAISAVAHLPPDLLVLDLDVGRLDGLLALEIVRAISPRLPVVLMASGDGASLRWAAERHGVLAVLRKPFRNAALLEVIAGGLAGGLQASASRL
jgi:CheY-like chemotaxis protein